MWKNCRNNALNREEWPVQNSTWNVFHSMARFCLRFILDVETSFRSSFLLINTFREAFIMSRLGEKEHRDFPLLGVTWVEEGDKNAVLFISSSSGVRGGVKVWLIPWSNVQWQKRGDELVTSWRNLVFVPSVCMLERKKMHQTHWSECHFYFLCRIVVTVYWSLIWEVHG